MDFKIPTHRNNTLIPPMEWAQMAIDTGNPRLCLTKRGVSGHNFYPTGVDKGGSPVGEWVCDPYTEAVKALKFAQGVHF